ncbi:hypothetical protein WJX73_000519 [Symbiochloris irregularis]|uniref:DUF4460 domain-containing protein n=1 Tax=Symbiochloris irregularis TaxID=706552 RepID=A0AAW1NPW9_9CHLO
MRSAGSDAWLRSLSLLTAITRREPAGQRIVRAEKSARHSSSSSSGESPSLKQKLRQLYKLIHPDLFNDHPPAREANGRSLQLLQEYLEQARQGGELGRIAGVPFKFEFYLHQQKEDTDASKGKLQHVAVSLPPPGRLGPNAELSKSTGLAIGKLFAACGLSSDFEGAQDDVDSLSGARLRTFMPAAAEVARQRATMQAGPQAQVSMMRTALRMSRRATVGFGPGVPHTDAAQQLLQMHKLADALDKVKHMDISSIHFMIGSSSSGPIDGHGRLWLDPQESALQWAGVLLQARLQDCHSAQTRAQKLSQLEASVATGLGTAMIYAVPDVSLLPEYLELLHALAHVGQLRGEIADAETVPICVCANARGGTVAAFQADHISGLIRVPVSSDAHGIHHFIQAEAPPMSAHLFKRRRDAEESEKVRGMTERRMHMRRLVRDPALAHERFRAACLRLMQGAAALMPLFDGQCVRVGFTNQVAADGSVIDIAWDFEV